MPVSALLRGSPPCKPRCCQAWGAAGALAWIQEPPVGTTWVLRVLRPPRRGQTRGCPAPVPAATSQQRQLGGAQAGSGTPAGRAPGGASRRAHARQRRRAPTALNEASEEPYGRCSRGLDGRGAHSATAPRVPRHRGAPRTGVPAAPEPPPRAPPGPVPPRAPRRPPRAPRGGGAARPPRRPIGRGRCHSAARW